MVQSVRFFDENTQNWWDAETGGANVPALNDLLDGHGIALLAGAYDGVIAHGAQSTSHSTDHVAFSSGTGVRTFPGGSHIGSVSLRDVEQELAHGTTRFTDVVASLAVLLYICLSFSFLSPFLLFLLSLSLSLFPFLSFSFTFT